MVDSISSNSTLISALMKGATASQNVQVAVVKKSQEVEKMQGEAALKLIESAQAPNHSAGIDVTV